MLLAAGIGSRFGGIKPAAPVGPDGEALVVIALRQAAAAGFREAVLVVSALTEPALRAGIDAVGGASSLGVEVRFAHQTVPVGRAKPLGTVDAVLAAGITGDCAVANGDDLYGPAALSAAQGWLAGDARSDAAAVLFPVERTLPATGGVSRAVAALDSQGRLVAVEERREVHVDGAEVRDGTGALIAPGTPVSMNLWCFRLTALAQLRDALDAFLPTAGPADELGLPDAVGRLVRAGLAVDALVTDSRWHGVTWPHDVGVVRAALRAEAGLT